MVNKKAQSILDVFMFVAIGIIIVIFLVLLAYGIKTIYSNLHSIDIGTNDLGINLTKNTEDTFGYLNAGMNVLDLVGFCLIFGMLLTILISNFLVKSHPVFFVGYILVGLLAIVMSIIISNAYSDMLTDSFLGAELNNSKISTSIMLNLPIWVVVITFLGGVFLFSGIIREQNSGGGLA